MGSGCRWWLDRRRPTDTGDPDCLGVRKTGQASGSPNVREDVSRPRSAWASALYSRIIRTPRPSSWRHRAVAPAVATSCRGLSDASAWSPGRELSDLCQVRGRRSHRLDLEVAERGDDRDAEGADAEQAGTDHRCRRAGLGHHVRRPHERGEGEQADGLSGGPVISPTGGWLDDGVDTEGGQGEAVSPATSDRREESPMITGAIGSIAPAPNP